MKKPSATGQLSFGSRAPKFKKEQKKVRQRKPILVLLRDSTSSMDSAKQ